VAIDPFQARVAQLALAVAAGQGFALAAETHWLRTAC